MGPQLPFILVATIFLIYTVQLSFSNPIKPDILERQDSITFITSSQSSSSLDNPIATPLTVSTTGEDGNTLPVSEMNPPSVVTSAIIDTVTPLPNMSGYSHEPNSSDLPILPKITPGFVVAGTMLIISGIIFTMIGIKSKWLLSFLSSAYLACIATTVLILYVIRLPVTNTIQGAYILAILVTSVTIGAASILLTEIREGLGSLLGGFCFSMWLIVMKPDGLVEGNSRLILIAALTIAGFASSHIKYTKDYSLIAFISFSGATSVILGIDFFSRAGLKEFWVYLWALNSDFFPSDMSRYPITRGMKVEIASIFVISIIGTIFQLKLWKIVQERRKNRINEALRDIRHMEEEEDNIGRIVKEETTKAKDQWEAVYGRNDKDITSSVDKESRMSGSKNEEIRISNSKNEEPILRGTTVSLSLSSNTDNDRLPINHIPALQGASVGLTTVRAGQDKVELQENSSVQEKSWSVANDDEAVLTRRSSKLSDINTDVPSPFKFHDGIESFPGDRSSLGTCATLGDEILDDKVVHSENLSRRSTLQEKQSKPSSATGKSRGSSINQDLVIMGKTDANHNPEEEDKKSVVTCLLNTVASNSAGAMDNLESSVSYKLEYSASNKSKSSLSELSLNSPKVESKNSTDLKSVSNIDDKVEASTNSSPSISKADAKMETKSLSSRKSYQSSKKNSDQNSESSLRLKRLTKEMLPSQFSKVFISYRTNEWAKHLEYAEKPEIDDIKLVDYSDESECEANEKPVPVRFRELQETSVNSHSLSFGNAPNRKSYLSGMPLNISNSSIDLSVHGNPRIDNKSLYSTNANSMLLHKISRQSLASHQRARYSSLNPASAHNIKHRAELTADHRSSFFDNLREGNFQSLPQRNSIRGRPATLMSQRDSIIKNKAFYNRLSGLSASEFGLTNSSQPCSSETGSTYNCPLLLEDDESMPLSQRRNLIRQNPLAPTACYPPASGTISTPTKLNSNQSRHKSSLPSTQIRQQQLASWRASVQQDFHASSLPQDRIEQQRTMLREDRKKEEMRRLVEERNKDAREEAWNEKMRSGEMQNAHREALKRLQQKANQNVT
ncbi:hypothetical protein GcC1_028023 [Golovinomyces cichoracearum]|uniref:TM7S3/TM198-like domain-containing protein n=1 Tax=Golovinomyces cichoracearum TaxID=62708 RepID=A0A420J394_9PEZI|nr:hypothetical protein GcC1_028023 [Golovinomyces cichoracearum]